MDWLDKGLEALTSDDRELIDRVYFQAQAQKEVAADTGRTVKAVEAKLARTRAKLKQFILEKMQHERGDT